MTVMGRRRIALKAATQAHCAAAALRGEASNLFPAQAPVRFTRLFNQRLHFSKNRQANSLRQ
ncbi:hypothetical protein Defa_09850 [Desulfovibrio sp. TH_2024_36128]|uniref:Uncharacterized protein n=1 Tax=Desulfovibrio falkowii TaxID=3136602 RepID=A0ABQ0E759_9BACT